MDEQQCACLRACCQDCSQQQLSFVSGHGALVAEGSMRRSISQYSSHALRADRYRARVDSGLSSQCCLHHRILTQQQPSQELSTEIATACTYLCSGHVSCRRSISEADVQLSTLLLTALSAA
jgi:hypothetical protein